MISANKIKHLRSLQHKKYRDLYREFIAEGNKLVPDLLASELEIKSIYALSGWLERNSTSYHGKNITLHDVASDDLKKISTLTTPNEVLAVVKIPESEPDIKSVSEELVIMLDGIRDPGNLGTIIRTADWFGISTVICSHDCVDVYNPKVVNATMGSVARVKVFYTDLKDFLKKIPPCVKIYGTFIDGKCLNEMPFSGKGIVIIGSEANGITKELNPFINEKLSITSYGRRAGNTGNAESLNAAIACSIVCYEFRRK